MTERQIILNWGFILIMFLIIAVSAVALILSPAKIVTSEITFDTPSAITFDGLLLRVDAWKTYPNYNAGLGIIAALSFSGAVYVSKIMYSLKEKGIQAKVK